MENKKTMPKIYELDTYYKYKDENGEYSDCKNVEGDVKKIEESLGEDRQYHLLLTPELEVMFFGDLDGYVGDINNFKSDLKNFFYNEGYEINMEEVFVYTQNYGYFKKENPEGKSYHFTVKGLYGKNKDIGNLVKEFIKSYNCYNNVIDKGVYGNKWWRLPNQTKEKKRGTEHKIIKGELKDFIITHIQEGSIKVVERKMKEVVKNNDDNISEITSISRTTDVYSYKKKVWL